MTSSGSYDVRTAHQDRGAELERLAAQARLGWENEAAVLERWGFHDATSIIKLGSLSPLIRGGLLTQDEADELIRQREIFPASDPFIMFVSLVAGGRAPGSSTEGRSVAS